MFFFQEKKKHLMKNVELLWLGVLAFGLQRDTNFANFSFWFQLEPSGGCSHASFIPETAHWQTDDAYLMKNHHEFLFLNQLSLNSLIGTEKVTIYKTAMFSTGM